MSRYARRAGDGPGMPQALRRVVSGHRGGASGGARGGDGCHPVVAGTATHRRAGRSPGHDRSGDPHGHGYPDRYLGPDLHPGRAPAGPADLGHHGAALPGPREQRRIGLRLRDPRDHRRPGAGRLPGRLRIRPPGTSSERPLQRPPAPGEDPPAVPRPCQSLVPADGELPALRQGGLPERAGERRFPLCRLRGRDRSLAGDALDPGSRPLRGGLFRQPRADPAAQGGRVRRFAEAPAELGPGAAGEDAHPALPVRRDPRRSPVRRDLPRQPVLHGHPRRDPAAALLPVRRSRRGARGRTDGRRRGAPPLRNDLADRVRVLERSHARGRVRRGLGGTAGLLAGRDRRGAAKSRRPGRAFTRELPLPVAAPGGRDGADRGARSRGPGALRAGDRLCRGHGPPPAASPGQRALRPVLAGSGTAPGRLGVPRIRPAGVRPVGGGGQGHRPGPQRGIGGAGSGSGESLHARDHRVDHARGRQQHRPRHGGEGRAGAGRRDGAGAPPHQDAVDRDPERRGRARRAGAGARRRPASACPRLRRSGHGGAGRDPAERDGCGSGGDREPRPPQRGGPGAVGRAGRRALSARSVRARPRTPLGARGPAGQPGPPPRRRVPGEQPRDRRLHPRASRAHSGAGLPRGHRHPERPALRRTQARSGRPDQDGEWPCAPSARGPPR